MSKEPLIVQNLTPEVFKIARSKIQKEIKEALIICGLDVGSAVSVVDALSSEKIPYVTINY